MFRFVSQLPVAGEEFTLEIKNAKVRALRLALMKQREFYKYAKMACLHGFSVTQSVLGSGTEMDLTEDQKKRYLSSHINLKILY